MSIEDGGSAFPPHWDPKTHPSGMSLRDYFAAKAMQGLMASSADPESMEVAAKWSYKLADAMLKAREEKP